MNNLNQINQMNLCGRLEYNDDAEFEIDDYDSIKIINISKILESIYNSEDKCTYVKISKGGLIIFEEDGGLVKKIDNQGVLSFFICGVNLDLILFNNTNEIVEFTINTKRKYNNGRKS